MSKANQTELWLDDDWAQTDERASKAEPVPTAGIARTRWPPVVQKEAGAPLHFMTPTVAARAGASSTFPWDLDIEHSSEEAGSQGGVAAKAEALKPEARRRSARSPQVPRPSGAAEELQIGVGRSEHESRLLKAQAALSQER